MVIEALRQLERESLARGIPIIGSKKGKWLYEKVLEMKPKRILELGTANGYSGVILGCTGARLTTIDISANLQYEARKNFREFGIKARIIGGDAVDKVKWFAERHKEYFDIIFIDFIKSSYVRVLDDCIRLVKIGGYIIADNITFHSCKSYKRIVMSDNDLRTEIINIDDGLACSQRLK